LDAANDLIPRGQRCLLIVPPYNKRSVRALKVLVISDGITQRTINLPTMNAAR
jgi:hypothetical protein